MKHTSWILVLAMAALGGCETFETTTTAQPLWECDDDLCSNSSEVAHYGVHELNLRGLPNLQYMSIQSRDGRALIFKGGIEYKLMVSHSRISGTHAWHPPLVGTGLIGAKIILELYGMPFFQVHVDGVREIPYPYGDPGLLETYRLTWSNLGESIPERRPNFCNRPVGEVDKEDLLDMLRDEALVFEGDRIDAQHMTMSVDVQPDWINFGCAGHTLAKLHLTRNSARESSSSWRGRQAMLKLLVADYCNTGRAFTIPGVKLGFLGGEVPHYRATPGRIEARWTEKGAKCIGTPRMKEHPDVETVFPQLDLRITAECNGSPPPWCMNEDVYDFDASERISANPAL